jgi:hypothetical protein
MSENIVTFVTFFNSYKLLRPADSYELQVLSLRAIGKLANLRIGTLVFCYLCYLLTSNKLIAIRDTSRRVNKIRGVN